MHLITLCSQDIPWSSPMVVSLQSISHSVLPFFTTFVSSLFFLSIVEQYFRRKRPHQLVWGAALLLFVVTAGAEAFSVLLGFWEPTLYRIYYSLAAIQVSLMGAGAIYLFASRNVLHQKNTWVLELLFGFVWAFFSSIFYLSSRAPVFLLILLPAFGLIALGLSTLISKIMFKKPLTFINGIRFSHLFLLFSLYIFCFLVYYAVASPVNVQLLLSSGGEEVSGLGWQFSDVEPRAVVRLFSPLFTITGGIALIGGAFYSYLTWQLSIRKQSGRFSLGTGFFNIYLGGGALVLAIGGAGSGFGYSTLYVSEIISVVLM